MSANKRSRPSNRPKGFSRYGFPIHCGIVDADGKECQEESWGKCEKHQREAMTEEQRRIADERWESLKAKWPPK